MTRALVFATLVLSACSGSNLTASATHTLSTTLNATSGARDQFVRWDESHQIEIVKRAATREEAELKLDAYRTKRQRVVTAFAVAYGAIASAAAIVPLVDAGKSSPADLVRLLADAGAAVETALSVCRDLQRSQQ